MRYSLYNKKLKPRARVFRKTMTDAEIKLWRHLRKKQVKGLQFYRQRPLGNYIVDFYCPAKKIVIEVDGGQHYEAKGIDYDIRRTQFLEEVQGLKVIRFTNIDVLKNIEGVVDRILEIVE